MGAIYFTPDEMCTTQKLELKRIQDFFIANDWKVTKEPEAADVILCVTCSGWKKLENNSLNTLKSLQRFGDKVISYGCVNDVRPDRVAAVHNGRCISSRKKHMIEDLVPNPKVRLSDIPEPSTFRTKEDYRLYDLTKRFVNIASGCSFKCTYCPHKIGLGPLKSRTEEDVLDQIMDLLKGGVRIVVLTGMETAFYGRDIGTTYPSLLKKVIELDGSFEIHVAQFNPVGILKYADELLPLFSNKRVTDIQIPIQTNSDRILKLMGRAPGVNKIGEFMREVKKHNKMAVLRTDIMVGFPSETVEELEINLEFATDIFDEIAVYATEIREDFPVGRLLDQAFSKEEMDRRVQYATNFVETRGKMAHGGQQAAVSLIEIEKRKQAMRDARKNL